MFFYDFIIMWLSCDMTMTWQPHDNEVIEKHDTIQFNRWCDSEILSFSSKVWFIELAEVFGVKIMCIYDYISAPQKLHI